MDILIIGAGGVTKSMFNSAIKFPWFKNISIVDISPKAFTYLKLNYPEQVHSYFNKIDDAISNKIYDSVWINTPSFLHYQNVIDVSNATSNIIVAKPLTNNFQTAYDLVRHAEYKKINLVVGHQMRYQFHLLKIQEFINSGKLGKIESILYHNTKYRPKVGNLFNESHPVLMEMSCHHFDNLRYLLGSFEIKNVFCKSFKPSWSNYVSNCFVNALIVTSDNIHLNYQAGYSSLAPYYLIHLIGQKGTLKFEGVHMSNNTGNLYFAPAGADFFDLILDCNKVENDVWYLFLKDWYQSLDNHSSFHGYAKSNLEILNVINLCILSNSKL